MADGKDLKIEMTPEAEADLVRLVEEDPGVQQVMAEFFANLHQAAHAVETGQYATMDDAMEAITGRRPRLVSVETPEVIDAATFRRAFRPKIAAIRRKKDDDDAG